MDRKSRTSRSASLEDTNEELSLWKQICTSLAKLENIQKETESVLNSINKIHVAVNFDEGISVSLSQRLKDYYQNGINLSSSEARTISDIIEKVSVLIALREASENVNEQKRKKRKTEADELKSSNSSPSGTSAKKSKNSDIIPPGTSVAAKQPKQKDKNEEWILAVVINFQADKNKYHVEDVDQDEFGQRQRYLLPPRNVIPVPDGRDTRNLPELSAGQDVLALYPGTTCFYKATVILPPNKNKDLGSAGNYQVQFEDDNNELKYVLPGHVLEMPKAK
ncbi:SGF29 tudor-like domain-containing protein [Zychaea mexicana]|uniref:SGF29 tudor-like domain-containing protein n=1 Tax=Zychaea mexicana TaxID=64656 RepID=UPI0022FDD2CB|nr:SGF29 tudor-like domain-containing protein [Zychaea mexicana]KAI9491600.1 SGF29 tudor-like domain-containing protein [Zychaea mexicana]